MKNYSRKNARGNKTAFRTGDRWRARKNISVLRTKSKFENPNIKQNLKIQIIK